MKGCKIGKKKDWILIIDKKNYVSTLLNGLKGQMRHLYVFKRHLIIILVIGMFFYYSINTTIKCMYEEGSYYKL